MTKKHITYPAAFRAGNLTYNRLKAEIEAGFQAEARLLLAIKLYELGKVSSGHAAKFCGKERAEFLLALPRAGVPASNLTTDDLEDELRLAHE